MRKVILQMSISIDGMAAAPKEAGGVSPVPEDRQLKALKLEWLGQAGCHIMGRTAYVEMAGHWPHSRDPYAAPMNDLPKVVFSRTLTEAPWEASRIAANLIDEYRLVVNPVLVGGGLSIFGPFPRPIDVTLAHVQGFDTGAVLYVYVHPHVREAA